MQRPPIILPPTPGPIATDALARALLALARAVADRRAAAQTERKAA